MTQLILFLKGTHYTCLRLEPHMTARKGMIELVGQSDSQVRDSSTRQSVTGCHCNVQGVTMCNRSLKQTAISLSSFEAEFYAARREGELLGIASRELQLRTMMLASAEAELTAAVAMCGNGTRGGEGGGGGGRGEWCWRMGGRKGVRVGHWHHAVYRRPEHDAVGSRRPLGWCGTPLGQRVAAAGACREPL